jgi:hypothetical protein
MITNSTGLEAVKSGLCSVTPSSNALVLVVLSLNELCSEVPHTAPCMQFSKKKRFIVPAQTQWTHVQRLSPENRGVSPYLSLQAGYRSKKQSLIHMWLHVTSLAISFPQGYVTLFMF